MERRITSTTITKTRKGFEVKNSPSPEPTGAAGKPRNTQMLEDVDELMPAKPWCDHAESAISPLVEMDIAAVHSVSDAQNFSLSLSRDEEIEALRSLSSWNPGGGAYDTSTYRKTGKGKSIPKRQRPTEVNTVLAFADGDSRIEIQHQPRIRSQNDDFDAGRCRAAQEPVHGLQDLSLGEASGLEMVCCILGCVVSRQEKH